MIGVTPASFLGETVGERPDVWLPLAMQAAVLPGRDWLHDQPGSVEKVMWLHVFGRLKPGVSLERAQANANVVFQQGLAAYYGSMADPEMRKRFLDQRLALQSAATGASSLRGNFSEPLFVLLGGAGLVLLIACSNLGNLLLARTTARNREMSVRLALGASRGRLIRQLLTESLCLATAGGVAGLAAAFLLREGLLRLVSDPIVLPATLDLRVGTFVFGLTLAAGLALGLLPALRITKAHAMSGLREEGRGIAGSAAWLRIGKAVVVGQLALSLPLLVGAGLLVRTLVNLQHIDLGYSKDGVLTMRVDAESAGYDPPARRPPSSSCSRASARSRAFAPPPTRTTGSSADRTTATRSSSKATRRRAMATAGRATTPSARNTSRRSAFRSCSAARSPRRIVPAGDRSASSTRRLRSASSPAAIRSACTSRRNTPSSGTPTKSSASCGTRVRTGCAERSSIASTRRQRSRPRASARSRSSSARAATARACSPTCAGIIQQAEPKMPILRAGTLAEAVNGRIVQDRLLAQLSIAFGVVAVLLAAIGLYGVLSYGVARRTNEIGIRKALGAQRAHADRR